MTKPNGGQAFPGTTYQGTDGMTLRDYFAGQALIGLLGGRHTVAANRTTLAVRAYEVADAMIAERAASA